MKKSKKILDIVFILDKSGSMYGSEKDTIGGYNSYIDNFKGKEAKITTVLFDNNYEMITKREDVNKVSKLTEKEYRVGESTALLDAIGNSILYIEKEKAKKVMFIITTDGYENSSTEFNKEKIKSMIKKHKEWEFIYIGADIDSYAEGESIGISKSNIANYKKDKKGISTMFNSLYCVSEEYCEKDSINTSWKKELDNYIEENQK